MTERTVNFVPLSDLAEINPRKDVRISDPDALVSFIPMGDVSESGSWVRRQTRRLDEVDRGYTAFREGDVLFAKITPCMENGKGCHATGLVNGVGFGSTEFHVLRVREDADSRFLYHWAQSAMVRQKAESAMSGSAGQQRVKTWFFDQYMVPALPRDEQRRIAEVLDTVDEAIQQTDAVIEKQQQVKKGLLQDLLTRGLDEEGRLRDPERHPEQFKESPVGRIPKDWKAPGVGKIASLVSSGSTPKGGKKVYQEEGVLFIRSQNVWPQGLDLTDAAFISEEIHAGMKRTQLEPHDVLLNITGASIGRCCVVPSSALPANVNQHVCIIRLGNESSTDSSYLSTVMSSSIGQAQINRVQAGGSREGLNYSQVKALVAPWPPQEERRRLVSRIESMNAKIEFEVEYRDKLINLKRGLMQDLLTGRVRIPEAEEIVSEVVA